MISALPPQPQESDYPFPEARIMYYCKACHECPEQDPEYKTFSDIRDLCPNDCFAECCERCASARPRVMRKRLAWVCDGHNGRNCTRGYDGVACLAIPENQEWMESHMYDEFESAWLRWWGYYMAFIGLMAEQPHALNEFA